MKLPVLMMLFFLAQQGLMAVMFVGLFGSEFFSIYQIAAMVPLGLVLLFMAYAIRRWFKSEKEKEARVKAEWEQRWTLIRSRMELFLQEL